MPVIAGDPGTPSSIQAHFRRCSSARRSNAALHCTGPIRQQSPDSTTALEHGQCTRSPLTTGHSPSLVRASSGPSERAAPESIRDLLAGIGYETFSYDWRSRRLKDDCAQRAGNLLAIHPSRLDEVFARLNA